MKIWLDDMRLPPAIENDDEGWIWVRTYDECIYYLVSGKVTEISLDHDLGDYAGKFFRSGYDVAVWIEERVWKHGFYPPTIYVHSANPVGRRNIEAAIASIQRALTFNF